MVRTDHRRSPQRPPAMLGLRGADARPAAARPSSAHGDTAGSTRLCHPRSSCATAISAQSPSPMWPSSSRIKRLSARTCAMVEPGTVRRTRTWSARHRDHRRGRRPGGSRPGGWTIWAEQHRVRGRVPGGAPRWLRRRTDEHTVHSGGRRAMLHDCGARVLFVSPGSPVEQLRLRRRPPRSAVPDGLAALAETGRDEVSSPQDREALAVLLYTAGTSGRPKAAMLSHRALLSHLEQVGTFAIIDQRRRSSPCCPCFTCTG